MPFTGFPDSTLRFFRALAKHQSREWFTAHKEEYEEQWVAPMRALLADVSGKIDATYSYCELDEPKIFRIHRDVRFSKDKAPYKTNIGGTIAIKARGGAMERPVALYMHIGLNEGKREVVAGAGSYMLPPDKLAKFRRAVVEQEKDLAAILRAVRKRGGRLDAAETLARVPKGFDPEHPLADVLKMKGLVVMFPDPPDLGRPALAGWLAKEAKAAEPLVTWTLYASA